jgi:hypothetical protein
MYSKTLIVQGKSELVEELVQSALTAKLTHPGEA